MYLDILTIGIVDFSGREKECLRQIQGIVKKSLGTEEVRAFLFVKRGKEGEIVLESLLGKDDRIVAFSEGKSYLHPYKIWVEEKIRCADFFGDPVTLIRIIREIGEAGVMLATGKFVKKIEGTKVSFI